MFFECKRFGGIAFSLLKSRQPVRQRHYWKNMGALDPPEDVRGMTQLKREAFTTSALIPRLRLPEDRFHRALPLLKKLLLKMLNLKPLRVLPEEGLREILLHPVPVQSWESLPTAQLEALQISAANFHCEQLEIGYDNFRSDEILKSVLPIEEEGLASYSRVGHIVHLNLREHLLPYKSLIGEVLRDKVPGCTTVVNKTSTIDNTYRNFQMELVCGEPQYQVEVKEHGTIFEFDFSKVYWNPRLSTEHSRIVAMLKPHDHVYDVFAGVGPFSVPAAKKQCSVIANDLNPESHRWLVHNMKRNKCAANAQLHNKDGRAFILEEVRTHLLKHWRQENNDVGATYSIHVLMNLPAMAVEFLDAFRALFAAEADELHFESPQFNFPLVHVYTFAKGEDSKNVACSLVEQHLGVALKENLQEIAFVRNVAPNKDMYRVSFYLTAEILTGKPAGEQATRDCAKKRTASEVFDDEKPEDAKQNCRE